MTIAKTAAPKAARKPRAPKPVAPAPLAVRADSPLATTIVAPNAVPVNVIATVRENSLIAKLSATANDTAGNDGERAAAQMKIAKMVARLPIAAGVTFTSLFFGVGNDVSTGFNRWQVPFADAAAQTNSCRITVSKSGITFYGMPACGKECGSCVGCALGQFRSLVRDGQRLVSASLKAKGIKPGGQFTYCTEWYQGLARAVVAMLAPGMIANAATCAAIARQYPAVLAPLPFLPVKIGVLANEGHRTADAYYGNDPMTRLAK